MWNYEQSSGNSNCSVPFIENKQTPSQTSSSSLLVCCDENKFAVVATTCIFNVRFGSRVMKTSVTTTVILRIRIYV